MMEALDEAARVYAWYSALLAGSSAGLGGQLLLASGSEAAELAGIAPLVRGANIAGAATLLPVAEADRGRALVREGVCDFLVTDLDEALRILKNELRRGQSAAVALVAEPSKVVAACIARGVQPELLAAPEPTLVARGAHVLSSAAGADPTGKQLHLVSWFRAEASPPSALDSLALEALEPLSYVRGRRWLQRAPQYLPRLLRNVQTLGMAGEELARFRASLEARGYAVALRVAPAA